MFGGAPTRDQIEQQARLGGGLEIVRDRVEKNQRKRRSLRLIHADVTKKAMETDLLRVGATRGKKR